MSLNKSILKKYILLIVFLWPYLFLFPLSFGIIAVGNDFDLIYFSYKRYIAEMLSVKTVPLWAPFDGTGMSLIFNPFAQFFYIPGWINYLVHLFNDNLSLHTYVIYTISAISIYSLGIFYWLKSFKIETSIILVSCIIIACSLKLTELIRFPNAAHAAAWMPWVLYGINSVLKKYEFKNCFIIFLSNLFILTAGYPYFIIYSLFLFIPYILFIPFAFYSERFESYKKKIKLYLYISLPFLISYLIALPWLLKVRSFLKNLVDRTENNWDFATEHSFFWKDTIGSWIFPPASSTEGWYYFGIIVTLIVLYGVISLYYFKKDYQFNERKIFYYSILFFLFVTYFSWGEKSILFTWSWYNLPIIGSLRTWPRINIVLIPFIILMFSLSLQSFLLRLKENNQSKKLLSLKIVISIFIGIVLLQYIFLINNFQNDEYWNFWQKKRFDAAISTLPYVFGQILKSYNGQIYIIFSILSVLFLVYSLTKFNKSSLKTNHFYFIIIALVSLELFVISNLQWGLDSWKTKLKPENQPLKKLQEAFLSKRIIDTVKGNEYFRDQRKFNINYPDNYGYNSHAKVYSIYFNRYEGKKRDQVNDNDLKLVKYFFGTDKDAKKIFFTKNNNHRNIKEFVNDNKNFEKTNIINYEILLNKYDGNNIEIDVNLDNAGWLSVIDNWDPDWIATINDEKVEISKTLNAYKSIKLKKGFSKVKFQYKPW